MRLAFHFLFAFALLFAGVGLSGCSGSHPVKKSETKRPPGTKIEKKQVGEARNKDAAGKAACNCPGGMECIPAGEFIMGCTPGDSYCYVSETPARNVRITKSFCIDQQEVSEEDYRRETGESPSVYKNCGGGCPVENVSWNQALEYCLKIGKRLPTEAEWEYATRGGQEVRYYGDVDQRLFVSFAPGLDTLAWYGKNSRVDYAGGGECPGFRKKKSATQKAPLPMCGPHPVKEKTPNRFGLYDMLGNVWEWAQDCYRSTWYSNMPAQDPLNMKTGCAAHVLRGGSWSDTPVYLRVSYRYRMNYEKGSGMVGFRCVK